MIVNDQELREGTLSLFFARGPLPSGKWELIAEITDPDGKLLNEYVYEILFDSRKQAEAAFRRLHRTFRQQLAQLGIETSNLGVA
jgi:hypothetical protein